VKFLVIYCNRINCLLVTQKLRGFLQKANLLPEKLREKLGNKEAEELVSVLNARDEENRQTIMEISEGKFAATLIEEAAAIRNEMCEMKSHVETRLVEEISGLRSEVKEEIYGLRSEIKGEISGLRNEMVRGDESVKAELKKEISGLREEMVRSDEALRSELKQEISDLREDMVRGDESIHSELHSTRADLLKWMFIFWVGQVGVITALLLTIG